MTENSLYHLSPDRQLTDNEAFVEACGGKNRGGKCRVPLLPFRNRQGLSKGIFIGNSGTERYS